MKRFSVKNFEFGGLTKLLKSKFFYFLLGFILLIVASKNYNKGRNQSIVSAGVANIDYENKKEKMVNSTIRSEVVDIAQDHLGTRYCYAGKKPSSGFDCSGFTSFVYKQVGIEIPHSSITQAEFGLPVQLKNAKKGDLIFFKSPTRGNNKIGHVGIIVANTPGRTSFIHSSSTRGVVIDDLNSRHYKGRFRAIRTIF